AERGRKDCGEVEKSYHRHVPPGSVRAGARYKLLADHPGGFYAIGIWKAPVRKQHDAELLGGYEQHVRPEAAGGACLVEKVAAIRALPIQPRGRPRFERHMPCFATKQPQA